MDDLRLRLIAALHGADCRCNDTPTHFAAQYTPQADAALSVFAAFMREQAAEWRAQADAATDDGVRSRLIQQAAGLEVTANGIVPPDPEGVDGE